MSVHPSKLNLDFRSGTTFQDVVVIDTSILSAPIESGKAQIRDIDDLLIHEFEVAVDELVDGKQRVSVFAPAEITELWVTEAKEMILYYDLKLKLINGAIVGTSPPWKVIVSKGITRGTDLV